MLKVLDLFSGIGGFSLGLERAGGFETVAFCEIEEYPGKVLAKHWPDVPIHRDVRELDGNDYAGRTDLICGGYPCQPFSHAGKRQGGEDDRHLWPEVHRLVATIRPTWCLFENVAGHISMGLDQVLSDLDDEGYASQTLVVPACAVDAPHRRDRVWIVAHATQFRRDGSEHYGENDTPQRVQGQSGGSGCANDVAHAHGQRLQGHGRPGETRRIGGERQGDTGEEGCRNDLLADPDNDGEQHVRRKERPHAEHSGAGVGGEIVAHAECVGQQGPGQLVDAVNPATAAHRQAVEPVDGGERGIGRTEPGMGGVADGVPAWLDEPDCGRVATGVKNRAARLKALGNAVVPQVVTQIGYAILEAEG